MDPHSFFLTDPDPAVFPYSWSGSSLKKFSLWLFNIRTLAPISSNLFKLKKIQFLPFFAIFLFKLKQNKNNVCLGSAYFFVCGQMKKSFISGAGSSRSLTNRRPPHESPRRTWQSWQSWRSASVYIRHGSSRGSRVSYRQKIGINCERWLWKLKISLGTRLYIFILEQIRILAFYTLLSFSGKYMLK